MVRRSPSGELSLEYEAAMAGRLELRVVDVAGRLLFRAGRPVDEAARGAFAWPSALAGGHGVVLYRLTLVPTDGPRQMVIGKVVLGE